VQASAQGFQTAIRSRIAVTVGAATSVNFALELGGLQQEVSVSAEAPQVNMTDASLGGLVGEREVRELPLNGRDWLQLTTLEAGVKGGIGQQSAAAFSNSRAARGTALRCRSPAIGRPATSSSSTDSSSTTSRMRARAAA